MIEHRYQYWSKNGIVWTDWFDLYWCDSDDLEKLKKRKPAFKNLKEEYREKYEG